MRFPVLLAVDPLPENLPGARGEYEYRVVTIPRELSRSATQRFLAEQAEREHWEIAVVRHYMGGVRRVWLRRRIIRVMRTA